MDIQPHPSKSELALVTYSSAREAELVVGPTQGWFKKSLAYIGFIDEEANALKHASLTEQEDGTLTGEESLLNLATSADTLARISHSRLGSTSMFERYSFTGSLWGEEAQDLHTTISNFLDTQLPSKTVAEHEAENDTRNKKSWIKHLDPVREDSEEKWYKDEEHPARKSMYKFVGKLFKLAGLGIVAEAGVFAGAAIYNHATGDTTPLERATSNEMWDSLQVIGWGIIGSVALGIGTGITTTVVDTTRKFGYIKGNRARFAELDPTGEKLAELRERLIQEKYPDTAGTPSFPYDYQTEDLSTGSQNET